MFLSRAFKFAAGAPLSMETFKFDDSRKRSSMFNTLRALFTVPLTTDEAAFREQLTAYAQRRELKLGENCDLRRLIGAVAADVFIEAHVADHLTCRSDAEASLLRVAYACYGLARLAREPFHIAMLETAAYGMGAPRPLPKSMRAVLWDALNEIEERRIYGDQSEEPEEIMTPRYVRRGEPLVLERLGAQLATRLKRAREEERLLRASYDAY